MGASFCPLPASVLLVLPRGHILLFLMLFSVTGQGSLSCAWKIEFGPTIAHLLPVVSLTGVLPSGSELPSLPGDWVCRSQAMPVLLVHEWMMHLISK